MNLAGASAAGKVVGRSAAFLYIIIEIKEMYAEVINEGDLMLLENNGIKVSYSSTCIKMIVNRQNTGMCPMEWAVKDIDDKHNAEFAIRKKLEKLKSKH